jgi:hypothetical protein
LGTFSGIVLIQRLASAARERAIPAFFLLRDVYLHSNPIEEQKKLPKAEILQAMNTAKHAQAKSIQKR